MKIAYFDCQSGISGDMTLAALFDAGASLDLVRSGIESLGIDVSLTTEPTLRKGFRGLRLLIEHKPERNHRNLLDILNMIRRGRLSSRAKGIAMRLFERIAKVEAKVHGVSIDKVHFHEVGAIDSIVDMVGVAIAWDELEIERACSSPIPVGSGFVKTSHGVLSVPAPATCELLAGVPIAACHLPHEMTTPTGAVILAELVSAYGPLPAMQVSRIGYGAGQREVTDRPNLLRVMIGHSVEEPMPANEASDNVVVLETNLDDISGEQIGFAVETLWGMGALDVFTTAIQMKKNRPGVLLSVICRREQRLEMERAIFEHTGTLGVRSRRQARTILPRAKIEIDTPWGLVSGKVSRLPSGAVDFSPEYEDCQAIAKENGLRLSDVVNEVIECYSNSSSQIETHSFSESSLGVDSTDPDSATFEVHPMDAASGISMENRLNPSGNKESKNDTDQAEDWKRENGYRWDSSPWGDSDSR
ncbi:MAG: nickel pincer cofactor biosynthesis protein LarC [Pirellula sp.]|nr:nickel pincer cofactor biosynthesis protein LarC [Pirellula sp.]